MKRRSASLSLLQFATLGVSFIAQVVLAAKIGPGRELDAYFASLGFSMAWIACISAGVSYCIPSYLGSRMEAPFHRKKACDSALYTVAVISAILVLITVPIFIIIQKNILQSLVPQSFILVGLFCFLTAYMSNIVSVFVATATASGNLSRIIITNTIPPALVFLYLLAFNAPSVAGVAIVQTIGLFIQICVLLRLGREDFAMSYPQKRDFLKLTRLIFLGSAGALCFTGYAFVDSVIAPILGEKVLSHQALAQRLLIAFTGVVCAGPFLLAPSFSNQMLKKNSQHKIWSFCIWSTVAMTLGCLTCAVVFSIGGTRIIGMVFERGAFRASDTNAVSSILTILLVGAGPMVSCAVIFRILYELKRNVSIAFLSGIWLLLYALISLLIIPLAGYLTLSVAYTTSWLLIGGYTIYHAYGVLGAQVKSVPASK
jgi:peptidoglycan biosynthesis protein MviN/MurJ (putative lipid II flippase)